jgi:hypothetical protein
MHRLIALDYPDAPLGHHWMDATHITFGVLTAGVTLHRKVKIEGSVFTGREPDENRYDFDTPRFDSQSGRLSYNPDANNALQVSYGFLKSPEALDPDTNQHRTTASWVYNRPLGADANVTTTLAWGQNNLTTEGKSNAFLLEGDYQRGKDALFARWESVQKSGHELVLPDAYHDRKFTVGALTFGYMRDLAHGTGIDAGIGGSITVNTRPADLEPFYGSSRTPVGFQILFRLRPSRREHGAGTSGMDMGGMTEMPHGHGM